MRARPKQISALQAEDRPDLDPRAGFSGDVLHLLGQAVAELRGIRKEMELLRREMQAAGRARPIGGRKSPKRPAPLPTDEDVELAKKAIERLGLVPRKQ